MKRAELFKLWKERDKRYAFARRLPLTDSDVAGIRAFRLRDIELLDDPQDQQVAMARLSTWRPPLSEVL